MSYPRPRVGSEVEDVPAEEASPDADPVEAARPAAPEEPCETCPHARTCAVRAAIRSTGLTVAIGSCEAWEAL